MARPTGLANKIIDLSAKGRTYNQIKAELNCSKATISYHLGEGQKEKSGHRQRVRRMKETLAAKLAHFRDRRNAPRKGLRNKVHKFNLRIKGSHKHHYGNGGCTQNFSLRDVKAKIGDSPCCYLTGEPINLLLPSTFTFDHIVPTSKGGDNSLENLALALKEANAAKSDMMLDEFLAFCEKVLRHHGRL